ncbi:lysophospholipid acyltransferase family protein [Actinoplanes xinjiangensis]|uniref:1-acyl-sn-glycerol-3-phosphate acyltransferase n=1 Tax=Actinoplanes xinjiangensis TaxID=512350 RepID=A0A316FAF0_9ACTN|nr:lysophospholipid acyltransferase family protein [Actinoplanes xinjiangensis]PWK45308.1 1-acyl-sn-glycerol-3-phosphate acyltransferase [Actinoplanes xinjiangensis]GIF41356.1 1-acyl-sn-glycerol-3-phosphate acyltransferase [Actinoplanes xinjiangensis]
METSPVWRVPRLWLFLLAAARILVFTLARLRVYGGLPAQLTGGPVILATNHVSPFDPIIIMAACHRAGIAPRFMATGGVFRTPVIGTIMRHCGHIRVDRNTAHVADALPAAAKALAANSAVLVYPEGRIGLDPWMWPERGKTGTARMAQMSGAPVLPVAQWGTHAILPWQAPKRAGRALLRALLTRPVVQVRFADQPVDLSPAHVGTPGAQTLHATRLIMDAIDETLTPLRRDEMQMPRVIDASRPHDLSRVRPRQR